MNRSTPIPYGPEYKNSTWRWGAFLIGVASFAVLAWIATLGGIDLIGWTWFVSIVLGVLFSVPAGRAWARGEVDEIASSRTVPPTVDVRGQAGSTYLLLSPAKVKGARVRPREFGPVTWALYSVAVRAPVALGDFVLTLVWRRLGGFRGSGSASLAHQLESDQIDDPDELPPPERQTF